MFSNKIDLVKKLEQKLLLKASDSKHKNIDNTLKTAAEMFIYLYTCPDKHNTWFAFYMDVFETLSINEILLTLNRILKGNTTPENQAQCL